MIDSVALFGPSTNESLPVVERTPTLTGDTSARLLDAVRNEASKGPYQIRIFFVRAPPMPKGHFGTWNGKCMVFYELWNRLRHETHWAFRPDLVGRILALARTHGSGVPKILLSVVSFPKRATGDPYAQGTRQVRLKNGNTWTLNEYILGFAMPNEKTEDEIRTTVFNHLDALAQPDMKSLYFEQRRNNSTDKLKSEIDPSNGPFWATLRSARTDTQMHEVKHLDAVVTTDAAVQIVRGMFELNGGTDQWSDRSLVAFATSLY
jgi:hypothetical protein